RRECALRNRPAKLTQAGPPPLSCHAPCARPRHRRENVASDHAFQAVGATTARDQGRWAEEDLAADVAREMCAEERQLRIGHWIYQRAHEMPPFGTKLEVAAREGDDAGISGRAGGHGQPVGPGACT